MSAVATLAVTLRNTVAGYPPAPVPFQHASAPDEGHADWTLGGSYSREVNVLQEVGPSYERAMSRVTTSACG